MVTTSARSRSAPRFRWWHALGIFAAANAVSVLPAGVGGDEAFYNDFERPAVAPPDWLFPPMWLFLNVTSLMALARIANDPEQTGDHRRVYALEGGGWVLFAAFNTLYFGLRSPVLGAADTAAGLTVGVGSLVYSLRVDRRAGLLILPRVLWLLLATSVSAWVARHNRDEFLSRRD